MAVVEAFMEILRMPISWAMVIGILQVLGPVWIPFALGVVVGWIWKPRWATLGNCIFDFSAPSSPSALFRGLGLAQDLGSCKDEAAIIRLDDGVQKEQEANSTVRDAVCRLNLCFEFEICLINFFFSVGFDSVYVIEYLCLLLLLLYE